ncbi:MAG TPA: hypothetical protein VJ813_11045 [Vicinamibacterales bacterium]|nr:hypothetical protein [Vicinamibacterales bacterium]
MFSTAARVLAFTALLGSQVEPPPSQGAPQPACAVATDELYAYTKEQAVQVGGSPLYGASRQRKYLDALRGPEGQKVQYRRIGQFRAPDGTILDGYEVAYEGLEKPVTLFLDWYHYNPQMAPRGFTCGQPIGLGLPPLNPFQEMDDVRAIAFAQGAARDFAPIPLGSNGDTTHGVVYDRFRMLARASRSAAAAGAKLDPKNPPRELAQQGMIVVAYPLSCGERAVRPAAIDIVAANGGVMPRSSLTELADGALAGLLPGANVPAGTIAITTGMTAPRADDSVRITYTEPACGGSDQVSLPVTFTPARGVEMTTPALPAGTAPAAPVLLQVLVDVDGAIQLPTYVGGPLELVRAATDAIGRWKSEPARINGAPVPAGVLLQVRFAPAR